MDVASHSVNKLFDQYVLGVEPQEQYSVLRDLIATYWIYVIGAEIFYYIIATALYHYRINMHCEYYYGSWRPDPASVRKEMMHSMTSMFGFSLLTTPLTVLEHRSSFSHMYFDYSQHSVFFTVGTVLGMLAFADFGVYWIHRWLHHPLIYKYIHKPHHSYKVVTPYASHAFHPVDGWAQSLPYHIYPFLFPINNWVHLIFLAIVNVWTVNIHDQLGQVDLNGVVNGGGHHDIHHREFNFNYGQYTTLWDRIGGSFKAPEFGPKRTDKVQKNKKKTA